MSITDELKAMEESLKGIKAPRGEGNGYNMPAAKNALAKRVKAEREKARARKHTQKGGV